MDDVDWPDSLDEETGLFYYYGDNKRPGHDLHDTQRQGNLILKQVFERAHQGERIHVPPIFIFTKAGKGRDVVFRGLAVPGADSISSTEDLVAVWKSYGGKRFQNYRAIFTVLDVPCISRAWIDGLLSGKPNDGAPSPWLQWIATGITKPLKAARPIDHRRKNEQLPTAAHDETMLATIRKHFEDDPFGFEKFSAELVKLADRNITAIEVTRPTRDGGRDAIGEYRLGIGRDRILLDFALEAKCYGPDNSVGVKETSRLISRLRHRQFGVLVTTSYVAEQAYREIREDKHPIIVIAGGDITKILIENGINTVAALKGMLGSMDTGRRTRALPTVAILAFGSLIAEPGPEIQPLMRERRRVITPFNVEFARFSNSRGGGPTLVPVSEGGGPVAAELLILDPAVAVEDAKSMLWRRETRQENRGKAYREPANPGPNTVLVRTLISFEEIGTVLYVDFPTAGKIAAPTADQLAEAAMRSVERAAKGRDGITYLAQAKESGIVTPLTAAYEARILTLTGAANLDAARELAK
jgi:hypothetical protein